jgi:UDP-glucose 4-epimerase
MILITGGMGFIGIHVARELAKSDDVVLGYNRTVRSPQELHELIGAPVQTEQIDVSSPYSLARAVAKHRPDGIVHMAVPALGAAPAAEEVMTNMSGLVNVLEAAHVGGVRRVSIASSLAVYSGAEGGPFREDRDLPMTSTSSTSAMKKAEEILALHYGDRTGLDLVLVRIAIIYGPLYSTLANLAGRLTHLAVKGSLPPHRSGAWSVAQLAGGLDLCHVDDAARAVAAIHRAPSLQHRTYNVGGGRAVSTAELVEAVLRAVPDALLPDEVHGTGPLERPEAYMDISRARDELGIAPQLSLEEGIRAYAEWLRDHDL